VDSDQQREKVMGFITWIRWGVLGAIIIGLFASGYKTGAGRIQAKWDRAEKTALEAQIRLREIAEDERDVANALTMEKQIELEDAELNAARLNDELQERINREKMVATISVSSGDSCAVVQCNIPDVSQHFRLFNCGISNTACETLPDADKTDISDGPVSTTDTLTFMDGVYGRIDKDYSF
jgi:hypothetical protein